MEIVVLRPGSSLSPWLRWSQNQDSGEKTYTDQGQEFEDGGGTGGGVGEVPSHCGTTEVKTRILVRKHTQITVRSLRMEVGWGKGWEKLLIYPFPSCPAHCCHASHELCCKLIIVPSRLFCLEVVVFSLWGVIVLLLTVIIAKYSTHRVIPEVVTCRQLSKSYM